MQTRILIADDHELISQAIARLLENEFNIVGVVSNGVELMDHALRLQPDVVILDIGMPLLNGIEAATRLHEMLPKSKLLFVTQHADRHYVQAAFRAGGHGYVLKQSAASEVHDALKALLSGKFYVSRALVKDLPPAPELHQNPVDMFSSGITPREREVLQLVAEGKAIKEIANILNISGKTVEFHKRGIMQSLKLRTTAELTRYALEHGIIEMRAVNL